MKALAFFLSSGSCRYSLGVGNVHMRHQDRCFVSHSFQSHSLKTHLRITPSQAQPELLDEEDDEDDEEDLALLGMVAKVTTAVPAE